MSDETRAAAALLYRATMTTLRRCRATGRAVRSNEELAVCSTPQLVDVVQSNDSLMHALALDYALRCVADLPPLAAKPKPAPREEWSINLLAPEAGK